MRTQLQIGEVAQLLGVTPKAIRHYQKIGLLNEPERTESGYRLYDAHDLLRLQRIRRLQSFGLSLKQIKDILGDPSHEHNFRDVLCSLDEELSRQIQELEERRKKIGELLAEAQIDSLDFPTTSPTFELSRSMARKLLGEEFEQISPDIWQQEARLEAILDGFNWPDGYNETMAATMKTFGENPELYRQLFTFGKKFGNLIGLPADAPEVDQLLEEVRQDSDKITAMLKQIATEFPELPTLKGPHEHVIEALIHTTLSPAQIRFMQEITKIYGSS